jgi:hypothetical protein
MELANSNFWFFKKSKDEIDKAIEGRTSKNTTIRFKVMCGSTFVNFE